MEDVAAIVVGAGPAGLLVAHALCEARGGDGIVVVEAAPDRAARHALAWWSDAPSWLDPLCWGSWSEVAVSDGATLVTRDLAPFTYRVLDGGRLSEHLRTTLTAQGVRFVDAQVHSVSESAHAAVVRAGERAWRAAYVFDSRWAWEELGDEGHVLLRQGFRGYQVVTPIDAFDPDRPILMDTRLPQRDAVSFAYVLPRSRREALVEVVRIGTTDAVPELDPYLRDVLGLHGWTSELIEAGVTPMTDQPFVRSRSDHVIRIGIAGGLLKPSTGYAFGRMQADARALAEVVARSGFLPTRRACGPWRFMDAVMLRELAREPATMAEVMASMFVRNPMADVFRFLDERAGLGAVMRIGLTLPRRRFLSAMVAELGRWIRRGLRRATGRSTA